MFVAVATRTMQGAKQIVHDEPTKRTPRRDRLAELSRKWQAARQPAPIPPEKRIPRTGMQAIIADVAHQHGLTYGDIIGKSRQRKITAARFDAIVAVKIARPEITLHQLGRLFRRDHTSAFWALRKRGLA
jgi:chromosomal replication initiation ATPase DnaA